MGRDAIYAKRRREMGVHQLRLNRPVLEQQVAPIHLQRSDHIEWIGSLTEIPPGTLGSSAGHHSAGERERS